MSVISVKGLSKLFDSTRAVDDISFTVESGEIFAILGPSGCGKTTTLRLIAGFETPDEGNIRIGEREVAGENVFLEPDKREVGFVFQDYALFPHLSVGKNISFGLRKFTPKKRQEIVNTMLDFVGLKGLRDRFPFQLSGGQQQRVALARALAPCPMVVLLDEPLSNLDADMRAKMREDMLRILRKSGTTTVLVTHDQEEAFSMADRVAVMDKGRLEQVGTPEEVYHSPSTRFVADFVGKADFIDGVVKGNMIETGIGSFPVRGDLKEGEAVQIMIRPDDISFKIDSEGEAVIEARQFKGEEVLYTLRLDSGIFLHSSRSSTHRVDAGVRVKVLADPTQIVVFMGDRAV